MIFLSFYCVNFVSGTLIPGLECKEIHQFITDNL